MTRKRSSRSSNTTTKPETTPEALKVAPKAAPKSDPSMVVLRSRVPRMLVLNLDARGHAVKRKFPVVRQLRNGSSVGEMVPKFCADSVTLLPRGTVSIPRSALSSTDVQNAIAAKKIVVVEKRAS